MGTPGQIPAVGGMGRREKRGDSSVGANGSLEAPRTEDPRRSLEGGQEPQAAARTPSGSLGTAGLELIRSPSPRGCRAPRVSLSQHCAASEGQPERTEGGGASQMFLCPSPRLPTPGPHDLVAEAELRTLPLTQMDVPSQGLQVRSFDF